MRNITHRWMVPAQSLLPDGQGVVQQVGCLFVLILVPERGEREREREAIKHVNVVSLTMRSITSVL